MADTIISTDNPLTDKQRALLAAIMDVIVPASDDGLMPGAGDLDFSAYLLRTRSRSLPVAIAALAHFDEGFLSLDTTARHARVVVFNRQAPDLFAGLVYHTYAAYYQDATVLAGIGLAAGPPFPRGNTIEPGDLTLLDPVIASSRGYRHT